MIEFQQVTKRYQADQDALTEVSFYVGTGEMAYITGHSGAGKSTLLKLVAMMEPCTSGEVLLDNIPLSSLSKRHIPYLRRHMGVVFQNPQLLFDRSVYDNIALPLEIAGFRHQDIPRRVRAALDKVGLLSKEQQNPRCLSVGEQQRVGIARAVVHKPRFLLADEPTGNLDPHLASEIMKLFEQFHQVGVTVLIASHDMSLLSNKPYRMLTLHQGRLQ